MKSYVVRQPPVETQRKLADYLGHNDYRFVFYAYGTTATSPPHYELHILRESNLFAELYISSYIVGPAVS